MKARSFAFVVWAAVAASVAFWGLRLFVSSPPMPSHAVAVGDGGAASGDVSRLLGASPKQAVAEAQVLSPELSARFKLTGVMASKPKSKATAASAQGVALISVDGKPARAYGVGARIDGDLMLQAVSLRTASIGSAPGTPAVVLELPPLPPASTGSLPPLAMSLGAVPQVQVPQPALSIMPAPVPLPLRQPPANPPGAPPKQAGPELNQLQAQ